MKIKIIGVDLANTIFVIHDVNAHGKTASKKRIKRNQMLTFFANLELWLVCMEPFGDAYHWARKLSAIGRTVRLMASQFVKPYVKAMKSDAADAEAVCEAVASPITRFVPKKTAEQQAIIAVHCACKGFVKARTAQTKIRGLLLGFRLVIPQGISHIAKKISKILEDAENGLLDIMRPMIARLAAHLSDLDRQGNELETQIQAWHWQKAESRRLAGIPGIGLLAASALVAWLGDAKTFDNGRRMAAWLRLVPKQHSSGGKPTLLGIRKRADTYLRTLLIHGARAVIRLSVDKAQTDTWVKRLRHRRHQNVAAVALANKNARRLACKETVWALLAHGRDYRPDYTPIPIAA
jgi:transposase